MTEPTSPSDQPMFIRHGELDRYYQVLRPSKAPGQWVCVSSTPSRTVEFVETPRWRLVPYHIAMAARLMGATVFTAQEHDS